MYIAYLNTLYVDINQLNKLSYAIQLKKEHDIKFSMKMKEYNIPSFPINAELVDSIFPHFEKISHDDENINILITIRNNNNIHSCHLIRHGSSFIFNNESELYNFIYKSLNDKTILTVNSLNKNY